MREPMVTASPALCFHVMDTITSPHDTFFRESFTRREVARDFLRCQLPAELLAELDLTTLEISKDSYVASDLRTAYSDLVYRVAYRGEALNVYLLFEHKSWAEHWTVLQLLRYIAAESESNPPKTVPQGPAPAARLPACHLSRRPALASARGLPRAWSSRCGPVDAVRAELQLPVGRSVGSHRCRDQRSGADAAGAAGHALGVRRSAGRATARAASR